MNKTTLIDILKFVKTARLCVLGLLIPLLAISTNSLSGEREKSPQAGTLYLTNEDSLQTNAPSLSTEVNMAITGLTARVKVTQTFENDDNQWVEGRYVFPLPENAAVDHLTMRVGERIIIGEIQEKQQAKRTYEAAKISGRKASLVEQHRPNIFSNSVANIGPYEIVEITIEYQQDVKYHREQGFSIRFPMTITPRYQPTSIYQETFTNNAFSRSAEGLLNSASQIQLLYPTEEEYNSSPPKNTATINVQLDAGFSLSHLLSNSHKITEQQLTEGSYKIALTNPKVKAEKDFVLSWKPVASLQPRAAVFKEQLGEENFVSLMLLPPSLGDSTSEPISREIVFVIDTSGSMSGESIKQAKEALHFGLSTLTKGDKFNVIQFDSHTDKLFPQAVYANPSNIRTANRYVSNLVADGGTEMFSAIKASLNGTSQSSMLRQVIFLTDGAISNEAQLFRLISDRLANSRLFTVGIGSAPNTFFMQKAARFGQGTFTYVNDINQAKIKMEALFDSISRPQLTHISIQWPDHVKSQSWPNKIPDLYDGEPIWLKSKLSDLGGELQVSGRMNNTLWQSKLSLENPTEQTGIAVLWAREKIASLMEQTYHGAIPDEQKSEIVELALKYHLVSRFTSLVAVDQTPSRTSEQLHQRKIKNHLPKGTKLSKVNPNKAKGGHIHLSNIQYPQTSLDLELTTQLSLLILLFSLLSLFIYRRLV